MGVFEIVKTHYKLIEIQLWLPRVLKTQINDKNDNIKPECAENPL